MYLFCHNSQLLWHPIVFHASLADLINRQRVTQKKRDRLEARGFCVLLSNTAYICDQPVLNHLLWSESADMPTYLGHVSLFKKRKCLSLEKNFEACQRSYGSQIYRCSVTCTLIGSFLRSLSEAGRVHRRLLLSPNGTSEQKHFLDWKIKLPVMSGNHVAWPSHIQI